MMSPAEKEIIRDYIMDLDQEKIINMLQECLELLVDSDTLSIRQTTVIYNTVTGDSI